VKWDGADGKTVGRERGERRWGEMGQGRRRDSGKRTGGKEVG